MPYSPNLYLHRVVLRTRGAVTGKDRYGTPTYSAPQDLEVPAWYEFAASGEDVNAQDQRISGYWVTMPERFTDDQGAMHEVLGAVTAADAIMLEGAEYQVVGEPGHQPGGVTLSGYVKCKVERVTG